jgi:uncharacterized protein (TIGR02300 family)
LAKPEWGTKRICPSCSTRYYDLLKVPAICPSCGVAFDPEQLLKSRRARSTAADERVKTVAPDLEVEVDEDIETAEGDAGAPIEDVSELEDDGDDFAVVEGGPNEDER